MNMTTVIENTDQDLTVHPTLNIRLTNNGD